MQIDRVNGGERSGAGDEKNTEITKDLTEAGGQLKTGKNPAETHMVRRALKRRGR